MRQPKTPAEFDEACRGILRRVRVLSCTSGGRAEARNERVGGDPKSKHLLDMARDFAGPESGLEHGLALLPTWGLWGLIHGEGNNRHLHVQGLPPGDVPEWWMAKYGEDA